MYHKLIIVGNLGRDPEMRHTEDGTPVTNFSVATNRKWNRADGSRGEETVWFRVTVWRRMAEVCNEYLSTGRQVMIEGRLTPDPESGGPRVYERNDGSHGAQYEVTATTVKFLGGRDGAAADDAPGARSDPKPPAEPEEEIPF